MSIGGIAALVMAFVLCCAGALAGCPMYGVYSSRQDGMAKLAEAESSRQIAVLEAKAKQDSAKELANAEVTRARGVAEANRIIGESLHNNEAYLRYLWIQGIESKTGQIIYVPTEANLPILEASRLTPQPVTPTGEKK